MPPEIWEKIFDIVCIDLIKEFNFGILSRFLLVSKKYMILFYNRFFGKDQLITQEITDPERYFRISQTLYTLENVISLFYRGLTNSYILKSDTHSCEFPQPWEILNIIPRNYNHLATIYNPKTKSLWTPKRYFLGDGTSFIRGDITNAVLQAEYFRLPTLIFKVTMPGSNKPVLTENFLYFSKSWRSFTRLLIAGFGRTVGVYHSIRISSLEDEFIFQDEILIET